MKLKLFCALVLVSAGLMAEPAPGGRPDYNDGTGGVGGQGQYNGGQSGNRPDYNGTQGGSIGGQGQYNGGQDSRPDYNNGHGHQSGSGRIQIYKASYGSAHGQCDFTRRLARATDEKTSYHFKAGNQWCGDPSDGYPKMATIEYSCRGKTKRAFVREGQSEYLRCR